MYVGPITWATRDGAFSMTVRSLSDQKLVLDHWLKIDITALATEVDTLFHTIGYSSLHPRILMRSYSAFNMPATPGKTVPCRGFIQFVGSAEVSGADVIPHTITGEISYAFDDQVHGASLYASDTLALIKQ